MKNEIEQRTCDHCGKIVQQHEKLFGGNVFGGWFSVEQTSGSTFNRPRNDGPWDFCCVKCCIDYLKSTFGQSAKE